MSESCLPIAPPFDLAAIHQACVNYVNAYGDHFLSEVGPTVLGSLIAQIRAAITFEGER